MSTDQPVASGGDDSAPSPYSLFLCSIGACAGYYVLAFCRQRGIPADNITLQLDTVFDRERHRLSSVRIRMCLPADFPEKYREAVVNAAHSCSVAKTILDSPEFEVTAVQ